MDSLMPTHFKGSVGADWQAWVSGPVGIDRLSSFGQALYPTRINGVIVHAFKFFDGRIWDINQGWHN